MELIKTNELYYLPNKHHYGIIEKMNENIRNAVWEKKTSLTFTFENPYLESEADKKELIRLVRKAGYRVTENKRRIGLQDVIISFEYSWAHAARAEWVESFFLKDKEV